MSCKCYMVGGPFIAEDPECYEHGTAYREREASKYQDDLILNELKEKLQNLSIWTSTKDSLPSPGMIVKRWKNGSVWAGYYSGSDKATSFDSWIALPI